MNDTGSQYRRAGYARRATFALVACTMSAAGCQEVAEPEMPTPEQIASYYSFEGGVDAAVNGNVVEVTVGQAADQLRRGGTLWAKVGPYVLLFADETRRLLDDYPDVAAVRVITKVKGGPEIARALLNRNELSDVNWRRALNIAGRARLEGTDKPALLDALVRWGEDHTTYEYSERYTRRR